MDELESPFPGLRSVGPLATQEIKFGVPSWLDWEIYSRKVIALLGGG